MSINIFNGDCFYYLKQIPDNSIDMVCADIPYGTTKCSWDAVIDLEAMWLELNRVCKIDAAMIIFSAQPFTSILVSSNIKCWKTEWIWEKPNATGFLNAKKQPLRAHENIEVFYRKQPTYNPQMTNGHIRKISSRSSAATELYGGAHKLVSYDSTSRYPRDVQVFSSDKQKNSLHPTQKPLSLVCYMVETYSNIGETILDFTMGSGTTGVACKSLDRKFIGIEKDEDIFKVAKKRLGV